MKFSVAAVAAFAAAIYAQEQPSPAVPAPGGAPAGCVASYSGTFGISNTLLPGASASKRTPPSEGVGHALYLTLLNGILYDSNTPPRFGYIAANEQLQFDNPIQAGGIYTEGWSLCPNQTLALGDTTVFFQCQSGDFYNIYYTAAGANCIPIELTIVPAAAGAASAAPSATAPAATSTDVYQYSSAASSVPVYSATSVAASSSSSTPAVVSSSSSAAASSSKAAASSSAAKVTTSAAPSATSAAASSSSFTGAAPTMGVDSSFFAVAAGAVAMAMF